MTLSFCFIESIVGYFYMFCCSGGSGVSVVVWLWAHGYCSLRALALPSVVLPSEAGQRDRQTCFARLAGWLVRLAPILLGGLHEERNRRRRRRRLSSTCAPKLPSTQLVRLKFRSVRGRSYYLHQEHQTTSPSARDLPPIYPSIHII